MRYIFNDFVLDTERFELTRGTELPSIEPQAIELLTLLVENRDRMVGKQEIYDTIWAGKVVSEAALSSRIKMIRKALGDDGKAQSVIRTVHGKGFRFVADVQEEGAARSAAESPSMPTSQENRVQDNPAILVLPFTNLSNDTEQEYFSDGISADIITLLSKHRWLTVSARNTSFAYKGQHLDIRALGEELGLDYVVEGSVQKMGNRLRVNAQLIEVKSGAGKWGEKFDRELSDIFAIQDEITEKIAARLESEIGFAERRRIVQQGTTNLRAWDYFHLGVHHFFKFRSEDNLKAQELLKLSLEQDPNFGDAHCWWAYAVVLGMVYWTTKPDEDLLNQALAACNRALEIDRQNATYFALRGRVQLARCEYDAAIQDNKTAISLNPTFAAAFCGLGDSLAYEAKYGESLDCFEKAVALSPNDPQAWAFLTYGALALVFKGDYEQALEWTDRALSIPNCQYWTLAHRVVAFYYLGNDIAMRGAASRLRESNPDFGLAFAKEKLFYLNRPEQIEMYLKALQGAGF